MHPQNMCSFELLSSHCNQAGVRDCVYHACIGCAALGSIAEGLEDSANSHVTSWYDVIYITRNAHAHILPRACQPMRKQCYCTEAARARALLTAREARLPTNLRARRKLECV